MTATRGRAVVSARPFPLRGALLLVTFGATGGTLLDALHTFGGTTEYAAPFVLSTAWWVPLLFANAYGVGGCFYALAYSLLRGPPAVRAWRSLLLGLAAFSALYAVSALALPNATKLGVLSAGFALLWAWLDGSWQGLVLAVVSAVVGCATEVTLSRAGAFRHLQPDWEGIPMWLPALYLSAAPSFGQLARRVLRDC
eukprot:Opistho-1_new@78778